MTNEVGRFSFRNVVPGRYYLIAEQEGYLRAEYGQSRRLFPRGMVLEIGPQDDAPSSVIAQDARGIGSRGRSSTTIPRPGLPSSVLQNLNLRLHPAHTIVGRVYNEEGARVPAAIVQLYQYRFAPMNGRTLAPVRSIFSDDNGEFRLFWLKPGQYVIAAAYSDYVMQPWTESLRFTPNLPDADNRYPVVFHLAADKPSDALPVSVGAVAAQPIDLTLTKRPRFNVQVELVGAPVPRNAGVILVPYGGDLCAAMDYAVAARGDVVEIRDVPAGQYFMMAVSGRDSLSDLIPLNVTQNIRNYRLTIVPPIEIPVVLPPGSDCCGVRINLSRRGSEITQMRSAEHDSDGKLLFKGVGPGSYYVSGEAPPGYYVSNIEAYRLVPANPFDPCTPPPPPAPAPRGEGSDNYRYLDQHGHLNRESPLIVPTVIPGEVTCLSATIRLGQQLFGRVVDRAGNPVSGALVVGFPKSVWGFTDSKVAFTPPDRYLTSTTNSEGRFTLTGAVLNTEYKLFAFEDLDTNRVYDPSLTELFPNRELIDLEDVDEGGAVQRRLQQLRGIQSVTAGREICSARRLCVLKVISAEETREQNMGR
jgi:protocatechuate 3,4-dioxygenase beta subunit